MMLKELIWDVLSAPTETGRCAAVAAALIALTALPESKPRRRANDY